MKAAQSRTSAVVCYCLQVTEAQVQRVIRRRGLRSLEAVIRQTRAGEGCTACHPLLRRCLEKAGYLAAASSPICSAR